MGTLFSIPPFPSGNHHKAEQKIECLGGYERQALERGHN